MVRGPKASRACDTCKLRRIKCDETFPVCNRCRAAGRECTGNLKQSEFIFRNENPPQRTKREIRKKQKRDVSRPAEQLVGDTIGTLQIVSGHKASSTIWDSDASSEDEQTPLRYSYEVTPNIEDIAIAYWIQNFAYCTSNDIGFIQHLQYLPDMVRVALPSSAVYQATLALSLTTMAKYNRFRYLGKQSNAEYCKALGTVNHALADPILSKQDETLLAVMLLAMHDALSENGRSLSGHYQHIKGAMLLLQHRGYEQFQNPRSLSIFRSIRNQLISTSIRTSQPFDTHVNDSFWASDLNMGDQSFDRLFVTAVKLPSLLARMEGLTSKAATTERMEQAAKVAAGLQLVDQGLIRWFQQRPLRYNIAVRSTQRQDPLSLGDVDTAEVWPGQIYTYFDLSVAHQLNNFRMMRIHAHEALLKHLQWSSVNPFSPAYEDSLDTIRELVDGVCGSVPFYMNYADEEKQRFPASKQHYSDIAANARGAYLLTWQLPTILRLQCVPELQRLWAKGRLRFIAEYYGFHQAKVFLSLVPGTSRFASSGLQGETEVKKAVDVSD